MRFLKITSALGIVVLLGMVLALLATVGFFGFYRYVNTVVETPTCIGFDVLIQGAPADENINALDEIAKANGLVKSIDSDDARMWKSPSVSLSAKARPGLDGYEITACQVDRESLAWNAVGQGVEREFSERIISVWIQRNNDRYNCDPNCVTRLEKPVDFGRLAEEQSLVNRK